MRNLEIYKAKNGELFGAKALNENSTSIADIFRTPNKYLSLSLMQSDHISEYDLNSLDKSSSIHHPSYYIYIYIYIYSEGREYQAVLNDDSSEPIAISKNIKTGELFVGTFADASRSVQIKCDEGELVYTIESALCIKGLQLTVYSLHRKSSVLKLPQKVFYYPFIFLV